ncbi:MAG: hypothetical protein H0V36_05120 [Chloroflexi bacterium]|nr:hypothetical protein [Chloroflexota bacterium]
MALAGGKLATLGYTAEAVVWPDQPKYRGKGMRIRALGYLGGLALVPAIWVALGRQGRYPIAADLAMTMPLLIDAAGNSLGIYDEARLDDLVHGVNTAVLASLFGAVISARVSRPVAAGTVVVFGICGELAFDALEYIAERLGFEGLGLSARDTIADVGAASIGALVAGVVTAIRWQPPTTAPLVEAVDT